MASMLYMAAYGFLLRVPSALFLQTLLWLLESERASIALHSTHPFGL